MSYPMSILLLYFPPFKAFKLFCNFLLTRNLLYRTYMVDREYTNRFNDTLEEMITHYFPVLY